jgi:hypothetical protein
MRAEIMRAQDILMEVVLVARAVVIPEVPSTRTRSLRWCLPHLAPPLPLSPAAAVEVVVVVVVVIVVLEKPWRILVLTRTISLG